MNPLLIPELREMVRDKEAGELTAFLAKLSPSQSAELIEGLKYDEIGWILETLPGDLKAQVFAYLPGDEQQALAAGTARAVIARLLDGMKPDDRAEFARGLSPKVLDEILPLMAEAQRKDITRLLSFGADTSGARMNTSYAAVDVGSTCGVALEQVRREAPNRETVYTIYVVDKDRTLKGEVGLKDLLLAKPDTPVHDMMRTELVVVRADEPAATAAEHARRHDLLAVPVVDDQRRLLGIVTIDDLVDVMEREATRDILSIGGVEPGALDQAYFENRVSHVVRKRIGWLLLLFVTEMLTGTVLRHYDEALARVVSLAFFIPLLIGTGGNAGSQTVSTIIRSLALGEIVLADWKRVLWREASIGLSMGTLLGMVGVLRSLMWEPGNYALAATVGLSLAVICMWANSVAALVPLFAQRVGVDPTVLSAPLIATLVDATGLVIYFNIAFLLIAKLAEPMAELPAEVSRQLLAVAQQAPAEWASRIREIAQPQADRVARAHEWLFPVIALAILASVLLAISRRYRGSTGSTT
jgi:magnesium transporter